jgi:hypothetical protein
MNRIIALSFIALCSLQGRAADTCGLNTVDLSSGELHCDPASLEPQDRELLGWFANYDALPHADAFNPPATDVSGTFNYSRAWINKAIGSRCLRAAVLLAPECPGDNRTCALPADTSGNRWITADSIQWMEAVKRIQQDQNDCDLYGLYTEYVTGYPHSDADNAAFCVGLLFSDPSSVECLEPNKAEIRNIASQLSPNSKMNFHTSMLMRFYSSSLWDRAYDKVFSWWMDNVYPVMSLEAGTYGPKWRAEMEMIKEFRRHNSAGVFRLFAAHFKEVDAFLAKSLLLKLGLKGDEKRRAIRMKADPLFIAQFTPQSIALDKKIGLGAPSYKLLQLRHCTIAMKGS